MANNGQGVNYKKTQDDFNNFGTPAIYPLVIERVDAGNFNNPRDNDSDFHKVMAVLQTRMEIYSVGQVEGGNFTVLVNWNTLAQDATASENTGSPNVDAGDLDYLQTEVFNATGVDLRIYHGKIVGTEIDYNMDC